MVTAEMANAEMQRLPDPPGDPDDGDGPISPGESGGPGERMPGLVAQVVASLV